MVKGGLVPSLAFFITLVTGPRRALSLNLSNTRVHEPQIRARLGTTAHLCRVVFLKLRAVPTGSDGKGRAGPLAGGRRDPLRSAGPGTPGSPPPHLLFFVTPKPRVE